MPLYFLPMIMSEMALNSMFSLWQAPLNDDALTEAATLTE